MSNYQTAREGLGARMREMRAEAGLSAREVAERLGWPRSKVSKLEHGKQTPHVRDLRAWAHAVGQAGTEVELVARLRHLETHYASWRRQVAAGLRARQQAWAVDEQSTRELRIFESAVIPGLLQTPDYARHMFHLYHTLLRTPMNIDEGVRARLQRQQVLSDPDRSIRILVWEAALHMVMCPIDVMVAQLDRLAGAVGISRTPLGIVPLGVPLTAVPGHCFWIFDERLVRIETTAAELRLTETSEIATYVEAWQRLEGAAAFGPAAHRIIARARVALDNSNGE